MYSIAVMVTSIVTDSYFVHYPSARRLKCWDYGALVTLLS